MKKFITVIMLVITIMTMTGCSMQEKSHEEVSDEVKTYIHVVDIDRSDNSDLDYIMITYMNSNGEIQKSYLESNRVISLDVVESEIGDYANLIVHYASQD